MEKRAELFRIFSGRFDTRETANWAPKRGPNLPANRLGAQFAGKSLRGPICLKPSRQTDYFFYQSVALPPLAAPAQAWKPKSANMNTLASTAAVASAQIRLGSSLLVFSIQPLEPDSGSQHSAL